jgi:hypothetical protein
MVIPDHIRTRLSLSQLCRGRGELQQILQQRKRIKSINTLWMSGLVGNTAIFIRRMIIRVAPFKSNEYRKGRKGQTDRNAGARTPNLRRLAPGIFRQEYSLWEPATFGVTANNKS